MDSHLLLFILLALLLIATLSALYFARRSFLEKSSHAELEKRYHQLKESVDVIKLENLESRLNPHLFKNILNSIQSHAYQTYFALDKLANVLDYILYESRQRFVSPKEEIQFALNLIEINKIKLSPLFELQLKVKVDEQEPMYHQKVIAPMSSVDLIENAFKHTDLQAGDSYIRIHLEWSDGCFVLLVSNKVSAKSSFSKPQSGIGTQTLEQRLEILHPSQFSLSRHKDGENYVAQLKIKPHVGTIA